jgi:hypothetical protein
MTPAFSEEGCVMVAAGAKGCFPSRTDDATKISSRSAIPTREPLASKERECARQTSGDEERRPSNNCSVPIPKCLNRGFTSLRCAIGVSYHSIPYALTRAFSIPRQECFRAGVAGVSCSIKGDVKRNVSPSAGWLRCFRASSPPRALFRAAC